MEAQFFKVQNGGQKCPPYSFSKWRRGYPSFLFLKNVPLEEVFLFSISSMVVAVIMEISAT
jgi:hypothetical protein